jgi:GT2 family glycosyltransferase
VRVAAVITNWNGGEENLACIDSILAQGIEPNDIVFVDNASVDGSPDQVEQRYPGLVVLRMTENTGYAEASNCGARHALAAGADAILLVNNDAALTAGMLALLLEAFEEHPEVGIVGPRVLYKDRVDLLWSAGGALTWRQNLSTLLGHDRLDAERWRIDRDVDYIPGCVMLIRQAVLDEVGLLDPKFFAYMEDIDYCLRARDAGFRVRMIGRAAALHRVSHTTGGGYNPRRKYMMGVNSIWFLRRHARPHQWLRFFVFDVASLPFLWIGSLYVGRSRAVLGKALGIWDGLRGKRVTSEAIEKGAGWLW